MRRLFFQTHYRQPFDFTDDALAAAGAGVGLVGAFNARLAAAGASDAPGPFDGIAEAFTAIFTAALDDDLNAPRAVAALFDFVTAGNRALDDGAPVGAAARAAWALADRVLDVMPGPPAVDAELSRWIEERVAARQAARKARDFTEADAIRRQLAEKGIEVEDTPQGPKWRVGG